MSIQIARLARRLTNRSAITLPIIEPRAAVERDLFRIYMRIIRAWREQLVKTILPVYGASLGEPRGDATLIGFTGDSLDDLTAAYDASDEYVQRLLLELSVPVADWTVRAEALHRAAFIANVKTAAGVDLSTIIGPEGARTTVGAAYQQNLNLIRSVSEGVRTRIGNIIFPGFQLRTPRRELAKRLDDALQIGRKRALRIASDQTTKLSARLDQERQEEIGITRFIWRHSGKVHFRPEHKARDGKVYSWQKNNLNGDLPGVAINCGCKAQGYVPLEE